jgi:hypothetical protein
METNEQKYVTAFVLTCPILHTDKQQKNHYEFLEQFFGFTSLGGYRKELTRWYKYTLYEGVKYKNASNLNFLHDQFLQLLHATFLIVSNGAYYAHTLKHYEEPFPNWLVQNVDHKEKKSITYHALLAKDKTSRSTPCLSSKNPQHRQHRLYPKGLAPLERSGPEQTYSP